MRPQRPRILRRARVVQRRAGFWLDRNAREWHRQIPSWGVSLLVHVAILLMLALWLFVQGGSRGHDMEGRPTGAANLVGRPLSEIDRYYTEQTLTMTAGNREEAARLLGIGERTLYRVMQDWKLQDKIRDALKEADGDLPRAAALMGIKPEVLGRKIKKLGLEGLAEE